MKNKQYMLVYTSTSGHTDRQPDQHRNTHARTHTHAHAHTDNIHTGN